MSRPVDIFRHDAIDYQVKYVETTYPNKEVECDVYEFVDDSSRDLAILYIKPYGKTPRQRVLLGQETVEGFISGSGSFYHNGGSYSVDDDSRKEFLVDRKDIMQWHAGSDGLVCYEICMPPYKDGRFKNLDDSIESI
ncbi:MAG TPA: hypothetical protein VGE13_00600 [Candidatus Saccharimonadales bacterium]